MARGGFAILGIGAAVTAALVLGVRKAKASTDDELPDPPEGSNPIELPPEPSPGQGDRAQQGGAQCQALFQAWQVAVNAVLESPACSDAITYADEWWRLEDLRVEGDPFYEPSQHEQIRRAYDQAEAECQRLNAASLNAMAAYEECMIALGLDPGRPSGATR